ncbi:MAG TPA: capsular biosynthesis protein [Magnetospirillum sp.]|nr:capsular biosynthesis protein [Magnetospirillum sp.]
MTEAFIQRSSRSAPASRHYLFLQGNAGPFFRALGNGLADAGARVSRVNFCGGDRLFWGDWNAVDYKGRAADFGGWIADLYDRTAVTDIILYNDCRANHRMAIEAARVRGLGIFIYEEGYLRPNWLTLEREGINGYSRLPDDPDWYRAMAARLPAFDAGTPVGSPISLRAWYDFQWQVVNYFHPLRYPHYRTHRPYPIWAEYATWATRLATIKWRGAQARAVVEQVTGGQRPYFLLPLQLDSDTQIRVHSAFARLPAAVDAIIADFAAHAPADALLVVKIHPLDNGWINYRRLVRKQARHVGVEDRVLFIDGGDLNRLIDHARGTVTINSTVGMTAVQRGCATIALGRAIYDMPGLTFQGPLAEFWQRPERPDPALYEAFRVVVLHACMVNGNFYSEDGVRLAVANSVPRLLGGADLLADAPPRRGRPETRLAVPAACSKAACSNEDQ